MNRQLCTTLPLLESQLQPSISEYSVSEVTPQQETIVSTESTSRSTTRSGRVSVPPNWLIADPHWST